MNVERAGAELGTDFGDDLFGGGGGALGGGRGLLGEQEPNGRLVGEFGGDRERVVRLPLARNGYRTSRR
ncbi:hypothetical protein [Nocardia sp. CA-135398]|uniref:hypothetical protein n=1 Tax=Nocardia sp. CA-135398 TaxID=3239977 RepID=UPI003D967F31